MITRFNREDIYELIRLFELQNLKFRYRIKASPELALCLVLMKLSFPQRYHQLTSIFGRSITHLSVVFTDTVIYLATRYEKMLRWHPMLTYERIQQYARAVDALGGGDCIRGFVDGTFKGFCRPGEQQRRFYSGYKKQHGYKYQAVVCPDGLVTALSGPFEGRVNDFYMVKDSKLEEDCEALMGQNPPYYLYGDCAYKQLAYIFGPFLGGKSLPIEKQLFNKQLSSVRISVEQALGLTQNLWAANAYKIQLKSCLQPVASYFHVAILLTNCYTCIYSAGAVGSRFQVKPPSLQEYLSYGR